MTPQERKAAIAEAREEMADALRRSRWEGWTFELREPVPKREPPDRSTT